MRRTPFPDPGIKAIFDAYPAPLRKPLLDLRDLIHEVHADTESAGALVETLKWNQPSYLTEKPKTGSTIRIDAHKGSDTHYAMYVHCQTSLASTYRDMFPGHFTFEGNRALVFEAGERLPTRELTHCIRLALTYHLK